MPPLLIIALLISVCAMICLWIVSVARRDASIVDLWWAPGFSVAGVAIWVLAGAPAGGAQLLVLALLIGWSTRMTVLFLRRRRAHPGEDPRYTDLRRAWGDGFWWKSLFIVFLLQAVLQWIISFAPLATLMRVPAPLGALSLAGGFIALCGLALETRADAELDAHKRGPQAHAVCDHGLRAIIRYPNYAGEILFWFGLWLVATAAGAGWTVVSPVLIALLLARVSGAPILEERLATRPGGERWLRDTPAFIPMRFGRLFGRSTSAQ